MVLRRSLALGLLCSLLAFGCDSDDDDGSDAGDRPDAAPVADSSAPDAAAADGGACPERGRGSIRIAVTGLPAGLDAELELTGPDGSTAVDADTVIDDAAGGEHTLAAERVLSDDPIVRALYIPAQERNALCVRDGRETTVEVRYALVPTSNKLWATNDVEDAALVAFPAAELTASASPAAGLALDVTAGGDVAFDRDGNLWSFGATLAEAPLLRHAASSLTAGAMALPDRELEVEGIPCIPTMRAMAFDARGNLWLSVCGGKLLRLTPAMLALGRSGTEMVTAAVQISGLTDSRDLAFDASGDLWVGDDGKIARYDAARLTSSDSAAPDALFALRNAGDSQEIGVDYLTFDEDGDLWATSFGGNFVAEIAKADLAGSDAMPLIAKVSLVLSVTALLDRPAFDDGGGLWISYSTGKLVRIAPADLMISSSAGSPTDPQRILDGGEIGSAGNVAFFPAAAGLPLYHAYP